MSQTEPAVSLIPASLELLLVSMRRQFFSRQTLICFALTALGCLISWGWVRKDPSLRKFTEEILVQVHIGFLVPIYAMCYGTAAVGGEREDRTLVYLLITPIPRPLIYLLKFSTALLLIVAWSMASLYLVGALAQPFGIEAMELFWPAILLGSTAYASLFCALGAAFRRGTIISLAYAFFLEGFLGNMPGIVKRVSATFYIKCMIYEAGADYSIAPRIAREMFLPVSGRTATIALGLIAVGLLGVGTLIFTRREYRDLS